MARKRVFAASGAPSPTAHARSRGLHHRPHRSSISLPASGPPFHVDHSTSFCLGRAPSPRRVARTPGPRVGHFRRPFFPCFLTAAVLATLRPVSTAGCCRSRLVPFDRASLLLEPCSLPPCHAPSRPPLRLTGASASPRGLLPHGSSRRPAGRRPFLALRAPACLPGAEPRRANAPSRVPQDTRSWRSFPSSSLCLSGCSLTCSRRHSSLFFIPFHLSLFLRLARPGVPRADRAYPDRRPGACGDAHRCTTAAATTRDRCPARGASAASSSWRRRARASNCTSSRRS